MKNVFKMLGNTNLARRVKIPLLITAIVTVMVFSFISCTTTTSPVVNYSYPDSGTFNDEEIGVKDYVTLGIIFVKSSEVVDGNGNHSGSKITYEMLMLEAQKLGADDVINIRIDINREEEYSPGERLPFRITFNYTASALAIKYTGVITAPGRTANTPQAVTYGQAARFILEASGALATDSLQEAFDYAVEKKWLPSNVSVDENARLDRIALLLMRSFKIQGGIFYTLTKNSHYAYLELVYNNVIMGRHDPAMRV